MTHKTVHYEINVTRIYNQINRKVHMAYTLPLFHLHHIQTGPHVGTAAVETKMLGESFSSVCMLE